MLIRLGFSLVKLKNKTSDLLQDSESRSPIHIAITSKHPIVTRLLLSHPELNMNVTDRSGQTPFAVALRTRDHEAAAAILAREPGAAEQVTEIKSNLFYGQLYNTNTSMLRTFNWSQKNYNSFVISTSIIQTLS